MYAVGMFAIKKWNAYKEKHLIPNVKYSGGSLMLWGWYRGTFKINGIINSTKY